MRREGRKRERERNINVPEKHQLVASCAPPTGYLAHNPGMCPDWESNQGTFSLWYNAQPTEPHQSEYIILIYTELSRTVILERTKEDCTL